MCNDLFKALTGRLFRQVKKESEKPVVKLHNEHPEISLLFVQNLLKKKLAFYPVMWYIITIKEKQTNKRKGEKKMTERFEEIFEEAMTEMNLTWYELFDSDKFDIVESRIVTEFGEDVLESAEYIAWTSEMAWEL